MRALASVRVLILGASVSLASPLLGCRAGAPLSASPATVIQQYAHALKVGDARVAYDLLSTEARRGLSFDEFSRMLRAHPRETQQLAEALAAEVEAQRVTATVTAADGEVLKLVLENGQWRAAAGAIDLYAQTSPLQALRAFVRAFEAKRFDILVRFAPDSEALLTPEQLETAWLGSQKVEMLQLVAALKAGLPTAYVEVLGQRATVAYGAGAVVLMLEEHGVWKVEEFERGAYSKSSSDN